MHTKSFASLVLFIAFSLLIAACAVPQTGAPAQSEQPAEPAPAEPVSIEVYYPVAVDAPIAKILEGYVADFEAENPDISVKPVFSGGYTDVKTTIQTTVEGGGTPPALAVMLATDLYDLINGDYIIPLDDYVSGMSDGQAYLDSFVPAFLANSRFDSQIWSIPFQRSDVVLYYNKDLFAEAGLEAPNSWAAWGESGQKLTQRDGDEVTRWGIEYPSGWPYWLFQPLAIGSGQNIVGDKSTEIYFDYPDVIEAVQFYNDLSQEYGAMPAGVQGIWGQAPSDFASGQAAMIVHSSGSLAGILNQADFEVGVMAVPGQEEGTYATVPGGGNLYVLKGVSQAKQDAAWKFIQFLTQPEYVADFSTQTGYIASREPAYETQTMQDYITEVSQYADMRDAVQYAGAELSVQNLGEVRNIFHNYLQAAFNGEMSPEEAMAQAQKESEEALEPFK
ncbi:MAG: sn-glycerol-3-phosphate-binding periplasmic protein UgpB [Anaerolineales bacterium]|nr:sn-glycerol-3-phosphate-binding periplasmic protein UgpB [Anaerolineales bacterium]